MSTELASIRLPIPERLNVALLGVASLAAAGLLAGASHAESVWGLLVCAIGFAFTANTLFALLHEAVHGLFSTSRKANEWAGRLAAVWFPTGFGLQRAFHLVHHRNNRSATEQFDVLHPGDVTWLKHAQWYSIMTGFYWVVAVAGALLHVVTPAAVRRWALRRAGAKAGEQTSAGPYLGALDDLGPVASRLEIVGSLLVQLALFLALDLSVTGWLACYAAFAFSWSSLQYTDHAFSPLDARTGAWNLRVGPIVRGFFLNYHLHLAHHQRPWVPWVHLGRDAAPGPRFLAVWGEAWRGPRAVAQFPRFRMDESPQAAHGWRVPTGADARAALAFSLVFLAVFVVFFGGASLLSAFVPWRVEVALPGELEIPFLPGWSAVYVSMLALLALLPFARPTWRELFPVVATLVAETVLASAFFLAMPVQTGYPPRDASGPWQALFGFADTLNMERNFFPSLHVAFACTAALALASRTTRLGRALFFGWAAAIAASTLLIHEHHVADVATGGLLAVLAWRFVGRWAARDDALAAFDIEWICLRNQWQFARRHRRYGLIAGLLLADRLPRWRSRRVLCTGFCFLQAVDDLLDGDRATDRDPLAVVDELAQAIRDDRFGDGELMRLAEAFVSDLRRAGQPERVADVLALMAVMRLDRCRVVDRAVWSREALRTQLHRTFTLSLDLLLSARGARVRAADAPELVDVLGWCSVARDLREDLAAGLLNVPADVITAAQQEGVATLDAESLLRSDAVRAWLVEERDRAAARLVALRPRLQALGNRPGVSILRLFARSIDGFARRRFARLYPGLLAVRPSTVSTSSPP